MECLESNRTKVMIRTMMTQLLDDIGICDRLYIRYYDITFRVLENYFNRRRSNGLQFLKYLCNWFSTKRNGISKKHKLDFPKHFEK